jgi:hypothetical protein
MDLSKITTIVRGLLSKANGTYSLQLQNHIYGCFLIMEDIAQKSIHLTGTILSGTRYTFDVQRQFSQIGIRYGFVMDVAAILDPVPAEYRDAWVDLFKDIHLTQDIELVDHVEDVLNEIIQEVIPAEEAYFVQASATGALPQEWVVKVLSLLHPSIVIAEPSVEEQASASQLTKAKAETAMHPSSAHRRFSRTRRQPHSTSTSGSLTLSKKVFARTRRNTSSAQ